ncbi:hypothetical protein [Exiguobacterium oxidotolerans]|uniref:hypothetical protein n=1 Tax=Exiguobacterium oxidotolerans TaxID=223958 RepID=UPI00049436E2|nr:hypothetical protein [Exiguobacterium oxidotolerans]
MIQLLKQIDDQVHHIVYHQEGRTLFYREGIARKEQIKNSEDMMEINEESSTVRVPCRNTIVAYRQKKEWIREKLEDGYMRSTFSQSEAIEYRTDRRIIKLRILSALLVLLSGLLTLTDILPIPGYITLVVLMLFWPMHLEGKSVRERFYRWSGVLFLFALAGSSKNYLTPINLSINGAVCLISGFILLLYTTEQLQKLATKGITYHDESIKQGD